VVKYILNQKEHHKKRNFKTEYLSILRDNKIDYNEKYLFTDLLDA
jgi:putative transposase